MKKNIMKVRQLENKNQFIMENEKEVIFQSYDSIIAIINKITKNLTLGCDWDYSRTTLKHLYIFLREYQYNLDYIEQHEILNALQSNNTKKYIQNLIDKKTIKYESELI